jgi:hypothetical protein
MKNLWFWCKKIYKKRIVLVPIPHINENPSLVLPPPKKKFQFQFRKSDPNLVEFLLKGDQN